MAILGVLHILSGISALGGDAIFVRTAKDPTFFVDLTAWGWIFLGVGVACLIVGAGVVAGQGWAGMVGRSSGMLWEVWQKPLREDSRGMLGMG